MKRFNKLLLLVIIIVGVLIYAVASGKFSLSFFQNEETGTTPEVTSVKEEKRLEDEQSDKEEPEVTDIAEEAEGTQAEVTMAEESTTPEATPTPNAISPTSNTELPVYTVDANSGEITAVTAMVPAGDELTPEIVVNNVIESLADQSIVVKVKTVTTEGDTIIVNFDKDAPFYNNLGSGYEASILVAIAQSLIDNLPDIDNIIYRIDDGPYVTGVYEYGIDEVYFSR